MHDVLICDRTVLDGVAYSQRAGFYQLVKEYLLTALDWLRTYDRIYFLRPNAHPPTTDGFRSKDVQFQADIDNILNGWINLSQIDVIVQTPEI